MRSAVAGALLREPGFGGWHAVRAAEDLGAEWAARGFSGGIYRGGVEGEFWEGVNVNRLIMGEYLSKEIAQEIYCDKC